MNYKLFTIILTAFILMNFNLGKWGIMETSEAKYAKISKEMVENKDYLHPKLLGIYHYHKPPMDIIRHKERLSLRKMRNGRKT